MTSPGHSRCKGLETQLSGAPLFGLSCDDPAGLGALDSGTPGA